MLNPHKNGLFGLNAEYFCLRPGAHRYFITRHMGLFNSLQPIHLSVSLICPRVSFASNFLSRALMKGIIYL